MTYLKHQAELGIFGEPNVEVVKLAKWETSKIARKEWTITTTTLLRRKGRRKKPKRDLYVVLTLAHSRTAHGGRQIALKWRSTNYSEVNFPLAHRAKRGVKAEGPNGLGY